MGDLMDEGSVAETRAFERYVNRFKDVFHVPNDQITVSRGIQIFFLIFKQFFYGS